MLITTCVYLLGSEPEIRAKLAKKLGKKGTNSDIALYTYQKQEFIMEVVDPIQYPRKVLSLFGTVGMMDIPIILIPAEGPDVNTAEFVLLLEANETKDGIMAVVHEGDVFIDIDEMKKQIQRLTRGLIVRDYEFTTINLNKGEDLQDLKERIKKLAIKAKIGKKEGDISRIDVDHVFPVKGIGTVILGRVRKGRFRKGETVTTVPAKRRCTIRSIQINDVDYNIAEEGTRVGLALRGVLPKDIERGHIITHSEEKWSMKTEIEGIMKLTPYAKLPKVGTKRHLVAGLQAVTATILEINEEKDREYKIKIETDKKLAYTTKEKMLMIDLNGKPKTIGKVIPDK